MLQALTQTLAVYGLLTVSLWTAARYSADRKTGFFLICAVAVYAVAIFAFKAVTKEDILVLPKGEKIYGLLCRARLMK